jgi:hypothetical protein
LNENRRDEEKGKKRARRCKREIEIMMEKKDGKTDFDSTTKR